MENSEIQEFFVTKAMLTKPIHSTIDEFSEQLALKNCLSALYFDKCYLDYSRNIRTFGDHNNGYFPVYDVDNIVYCQEDYHRYIFFNWEDRKAEFREECKKESKERPLWISVKRIQPYEITNLEQLILKKIDENEKYKKDYESN